MKTPNTLLTCSALAALALAVAPVALGQNVQSTTRGNTELSNADQQNGLSKAHKASSLIGMDVRNQQNEKLGEIKDLAVDLPSGKISYAVIGVGGFLGIGDKYVAVPPNAFSLAPDQGTVVLNADKAKIQNAPSFAKNSWPDLNSPTWRTDSAYWLSDNSALGSPASGTSGTAHSSSETSATHHADRDTFHGRITALNTETRTMTVQGPSGTREFKLSDQPTLTLKENRSPRLTDFKVGYPVVVGFHEANGSYIADSLTRADTPEVK
jgi:sporulation protein YlmC with PRC-barrel domain